MHRTFAIFSFQSGRRHLEAVVISKPEPPMIATAIGSRLDGIVLPGLYEAAGGSWRSGSTATSRT